MRVFDLDYINMVYGEVYKSDNIRPVSNCHVHHDLTKLDHLLIMTIPSTTMENW